MDKLISALQIPSPIQSFCFEEFPDRNILIKRDDLIHPHVSGNKWRKLKYNLKHAKDEGYEGIISFGGAFSNHLYALAAACKLANLKCKAFVRGDGFDKANPTLRFLLDQGVELTFIDRTSYRRKTDLDFLSEIQQRFPNYYIVPEGGSNELAVNGVTEIMDEIYSQIPNKKLTVICGVGSGSTITGITKALRGSDNAIGILAVKDTSLPDKIMQSLTKAEQDKLHLDLNAHLGGFGKTSPDLIKLVNTFYTRLTLPLEPLYTAKVVLRLKSLLQENYFDRTETIVVIHTGGLQGNLGFDYRFPEKLDVGLISNLS